MRDSFSIAVFQNTVPIRKKKERDKQWQKRKVCLGQAGSVNKGGETGKDKCWDIVWPKLNY